MINEIYRHSTIPSKIKKFFIGIQNDEHLDENCKNLSQSEFEKLNLEIAKAFNILSTLTYDCSGDNSEILGFYDFLNENVKYISPSRISCKEKIFNDALNINNFKLAKSALTFLSFYAKTDTVVSDIILNQLDQNLLHDYFQTNNLNSDLCDFLISLMNFSPHAPFFCQTHGYFDDIIKQKVYTTTQIGYKLSLIKSSVLSFSHFQEHQKILNKFLKYICGIISENSLPIEIQETSCDCILQCLVRLSEKNQLKCIERMFRNTEYDILISYWSDSLITIDKYLAIYIYIVCYFFPAQLLIRRPHVWIASHFQTKFNDQIEKNKINEVKIFLIYDLIAFIKKKPDCLYELIILDKPFFIQLNNILENEAYNMKEAVIQLFAEFIPLITVIKYPRISNFIIEFQIIPKFFSFLDELDGETLDHLLDILKFLIKSLKKLDNFNENPIIVQIKNDITLKILMNVYLENSNEEIQIKSKIIKELIFDN